MDELKFENMKANPLLKANILSKLTLWFMNPLMRLGAKRSLELEDHCELMPNEDSEYLTNELEKCYEKVKHTGKKTNDQLHRAIIDMFGLEFHLLGLLLFFHEFLRILQPFLLGRLIRYFKYCSATTVLEAYVYAAGVSITAVLLTVTHNYPYIHQINLISIRLTAALNGLIYKKVLKMKASCLQEAERGRVLNLMSNDVSRMESVTVFWHYFYVTPFSLFGSIALAWYEMGPSCLAGFAFLLLMIPIQGFFGRKSGYFRGKASHLADIRITLVTDLLNFIKAIKIYVWEEPLINVINNVRKKEINMLKIQTVLQGVLIELHFVSGKFVVLCAIGAHVSFGGRIGAEMVFVTACLLNSIRTTMTWYLASAMQGYSEYKSTLLHSLCRETNVIGGQMIVEGSLAYVPQDPWVFSGTVQQNIKCGRTDSELCGEKSYEKVLTLCHLDHDLNTFSSGDRTIIGDQGATLSGGQRARISLARAIYSDSDIYLLDDPLSSVDASMMHSLFEKCIVESLAGKTRILATHQVQYLKYADLIVIMKHGKVAASGTYSELVNLLGDFSPAIEQESLFRKIDGAVEDFRDSKLSEIDTETKAKDATNRNKKLQQWQNEEMLHGSVKWGVYFDYFRNMGGIFALICLAFLCFTVQLSFNFSDYWLNIWSTSQDFLVAMESKGNESDSSTKICKATVKRNDSNNASYFPITSINNRDYFIIFASSIVLLTLLSLIRSIIFRLMINNAALNLHGRMLKSVLYAPLTFFMENPVGRILNRFSKDTGVMDEQLTLATYNFLSSCFTCLGILVTLIILNRLILIITIPLLGAFLYLRWFFMKSSRSIRRLKASTCYSYITSKYKKFRCREEIFYTCTHKFNVCKSLDSASFATSRWLSNVNDWLCCIFLIFVTFVSIAFPSNQSSGSIGLALFYVTWLLGFVRWFVRQSTEMENSIVSVERILDYTNLKPEWYAKLNEKSVIAIDKLEHWPKAGKIEFIDVSLIYGENSNMALKNLSFKIQAGEKVGILGRSGAGKSSILNVVERLYEFRGQILIDDVDIRQIDLYEFRKRISVIPQESILFNGTLRKNLDPFDEFSDDQLWKALEQRKLRLLGNRPTTHLSDRGLNLSVGQRQLICLARAMLKRNKVVLIDEATSHVDPITDTIVQNLIAEQFSESTILIIAHRLRTIMNCTKIMVMKDGRLVEMGEPTTLGHKVDSHFYKLLKESAI